MAVYDTMRDTMRDGERQRKPFGLIANEADAMAIARRLAATGHRLLHAFLETTPKTAPKTTGLTGRESLNLESASLFDIALECEVIAICVDDTKLVREILFGTHDMPGVAADMAPGSVIIDFGIRAQRETQALLGLTGMRGIGVIDAALIGGSDCVLRGTASVLAGGFPDAVETAMPLLCELGQVERTGPLGSAQTAAALMGYVEASHFAACSDALTFGRALGLRVPALSRIFSDRVSEDNILRLTRSTDLVRVLAEEQGAGADVIDLNRSRVAARRLAEAANGESG